MANRRFIDFPIASTVGDNDIVLIWQDGANKQTTKATILSGLPENLDELNDVVISGLTNGQILRYDSVTGKWINTDQGNLDLNDLNDVSIISPTNGQVLVYNSSTGKWENSSGGYVPYTGAVTTVNLGAQTIQAGSFVKAGGTSSQFLKADGSIDSTAYGTGTVTSVGLTMPSAFSVANSPITSSGTLAVTATGNTTQYIAGDGSLVAFPITGQAGTLVREVRNNTGATLTKGTVVYINGALGNKPTVAKAIATGDSTSAQTFGLIQADIPNNSNGYLVAFGDLDGINTSGITEGSQLYLSSSVAGGYTTVKQYAPNHLVYIGVVTRAHPTDGRIEVRIQNGYEMDELHNVAAQNPDNNDILQYKTSTNLWTKVAGTTTNIAEGSNLYYTEARVNANANVAANTAARHNAVTLGTANGLSLSTQVLSLGLASAGVTGALSGTDWSTFNAKQNALTLTTTGTSGAATLVGSTLNIPIYSPDLSGYVPTTRTITINGVTQDLSANRTFNVGTVTSVGLSSATSGVTIGGSPVTGVGAFTLTIATASGSQQGLLSASDWTTFNNKQNALTNPVTGTGTTNYLAKFTGGTTIGNSQIFDNGTNVGINQASPTRTLDILGASGIGTVLKLQGASGTTTYLQLAYNGATNAQSGYIGYNSSSQMQFFTNDTLAMTIDSNRNLGLGVTPSSWASDFRAMQIGLGTSLYNNGNTNGTFLGSNFFFNGSNNIYIGTGTATAYAQSLGTHAWYTAPSGTAGNAISFTQAMTLTAAGRLLINTPTESTFHLDVNGTGRFSQTGAVPLTVVRTSANSNVGIRYQNNTTSWYSGLASDDSFSVSFNDANLAAGQFKLTTSGAATFSSSVTATELTLNKGASDTIGAGSYVYYSNVGGTRGAVHQLNASFGLDTFTFDGSTWSRRMTVTNNGNVGIGTTSPNGKLRIQNDNSTIPSLIVRDGGTPTANLIEATSNAYGSSFIVTAIGNVGIGTSSPQEPLHISTSGADKFIRIENSNSYTGIWMNDSGSNNGWLLMSGYTNATSPGDFAIREYGVQTSLVIKQTSGNVLIGTTTDVGARLHLNGDIRTAAPTGGNAVNWRLGTVRGGTVTPNATVRVEIGGVLVDLDARYV